MSGWAEESLCEAIDVLARSGRNDLASDLSRLLDSLDFEDLDILRSPLAEQVALEILEADTFLDLSNLMHHMAEALGVAHVTLHVVEEAPSTNFATKVVTTYPNSWISLYVNRRFFVVDPVGQTCVRHQQSFFWRELDQTSPAVRYFWAEAAAHGVSSVGYTHAITTDRGDRLALSICSAEDELDFQERVMRHQSDILHLGIYLAETFCRLASTNRPSTFQPTDDQLIILRAIALGQDEMDLEMASYQFGSYKTLKRSICELFQTKTLAQAAVLAARIGLLADAPLTKADILSSTGDSVHHPPSVVTASLKRLAHMRNGPPEDVLT